MNERNQCTVDAKCFYENSNTVWWLFFGIEAWQNPNETFERMATVIFESYFVQCLLLIIIEITVISQSNMLLIVVSLHF